VRYQPISIKKFQSGDGDYFRVLVGNYSTPKLAHQALEGLKSLHYEGLIVRLDP